MRKIAKLALLALAAMAAATQAVWDGTKWTLKALFAPPQAQGVEVEDAMEAVAARAAAPVTPSQAVRDTVTPAPAPKPKATPKAAPAPLESCDVVELDPILAKGRIAHDYALALGTLDGEPSTKGLDEAAAAWLHSLNSAELMHVWRNSPLQVGAHMAGVRLIEGLPLCPSMAEYKHALGNAARITPQQRADIKEWEETMDAAFNYMISDPTFELKCGI